MTNAVTYDARCYYVGGKPIWLVSGTIHYFRVPHELWQDRITKAKLGGLNCIETYVVWNRHEPEEGTFDFQGDLDVGRFFSLIEKAGLYIIVRPGPYICSEWDNGALPAWLTSKPGVRPRVNEPIYLGAVDRYFDRLLPIIAEHQVTRGGGVILVQNENEYLFAGRPGGREYLEHLNRKLRSGGIEVPIIVCNHLKVPIPDTVECWNAWDEITEGIQKIRAAQPNAPKMVTEFWDGWFECWGQAPGANTKPPAAIFRRTCEILGFGAMWNYYVWHGGTNFGFWAGCSAPGPLSSITTSYDFAAPLSEAGLITRKCLVTKIANWMARNLSRFLCQASPAEPSASVEGPFLLQELRSEGGSLLVVRTASDDQQEKTARLRLPDGRQLQVDLTDLGAAVLPVGLRMWQTPDGRVIDYANASLLSTNPIIFFGPAGTPGLASIDGEEHTFTFPSGDEPQTITMRTGDVLALSTEGAENLWVMDDGELVFGQRDFPNAPGIRPALHGLQAPKLETWRTSSSFPPILGKGDWTPIPGPKSMDELGHYLGYGWYRCEFESDSERETSLYFPKAGDRLLTFLNGAYVGTWGAGTGATCRPLKVTLPKGANRLIFLADNMGRANWGRKVGELKGIWGDVGLDWREAPIPATTEASGGVPEEARGQWELAAVWWDAVPDQSRSVIWEVDLRTGESLHLSIFDLAYYAYVLVNGRVAHYHVARDATFTDLCRNEFPLEEFVRPGRNMIELRVLGCPADAALSGFALYAYEKDAVLRGDWTFAPFDPSQAQEGDGGSHPLRVHKTSFRSPALPVPLFLDFRTLGKGQVYLNGRPLGRYWSIGPQQRLYIPEPWVKPANTLVVFEEEGKEPGGVRIETG